LPSKTAGLCCLFKGTQLLDTGERMKPHGDYKIRVSNNIVHVFPVGGFNPEGIEALHKDIVSSAPANSWVLFEHPCDTAGLTPEAVDAIVRSYQNLAKINCVAIALEISSTWKYLFEKNIVAQIAIPVYLDNRVDVLEKNVDRVLNRAS